MTNSTYQQRRETWEKYQQMHKNQKERALAQEKMLGFKPRKADGSCHSGFKPVDRVYGMGPACAPYRGSCANGILKPQAQRTQDDDCWICYRGFKLVNNTCKPKYEGSCANGTLKPVAQRTRDDDCGSCNSGFELRGWRGPARCGKIYGGSCANGILKHRWLRTQEDHCGSCNSGFKLVNNACQPNYGGSCANGSLKPVAQRTRENDCGSCNSGYNLVNNACQPIYGGSCANGSLKPVAQRTRNNHCGSCKSGYRLSNFTCIEISSKCSGSTPAYDWKSKQCRALKGEEYTETTSLTCTGRRWWWYNYWCGRQTHPACVRGWRRWYCKAGPPKTTRKVTFVGEEAIDKGTTIKKPQQVGGGYRRGWGTRTIPLAVGVFPAPTTISKVSISAQMKDQGYGTVTNRVCAKGLKDGKKVFTECAYQPRGSWSRRRSYNTTSVEKNVSPPAEIDSLEVYQWGYHGAGHKLWMRNAQVKIE